MSDAGGWNKPEYYGTIQTNKIQINGKDKLLLTARGGSGIYISEFDNKIKKWLPLNSGSNMPDQHGWSNPCYSKTIQTRVIKIKGHDHLALIARGCNHTI